MLWLCISLPQLPLEALSTQEQERAIVVTAFEGNARWIVCCNRAAEQVHLKRAMNCTLAMAICPSMIMLERNLRAEQSALGRLAGWAYQFSSTIILGKIATSLDQACNAVLWLEIGASLKLFGGFRSLIESIERELGELEYSYRLGIGPTIEGAALLARADIRMAVTSPHALYSRLRNLPIDRLGLSTQINQQLVTAGIRTIGLLLELPRDSIAKRFGPEMSNFLDRLTGEAADPRPTFSLPAQYDAHFDFEFELKNTESLLFPLKRMLREFSGFLRGHDLGVQHFTLSFEHRESAATSLRIGLSLAERDPEKFLALIREQLERTQLPMATVGLRLTADQFSEPATLQPDLFSSTLQHHEDLAHTLDRISARLGDDRVYGLKPVADHRPEASWAITSPRDRATTIDFPKRPLWLLPEPKPLQLSALPQIWSGPERIESGWWDTGDVERDYYILHTSNGADLWVYRDLSKNGEWYLHGFWS